MADAIDYFCPFCSKPTVLIPERISKSQHRLTLQNADGLVDLVSTFCVCPNPQCRKASLKIELFPVTMIRGAQPGSSVPSHGDGRSWGLIPPSMAKAFPSYIPIPIREDYEEACLIIDGSAKASATLARRCLQGMIRDFWGIQKATLFAEIEELKPKLDSLTWQAIDSVRTIGNIGAHMEKDVNVIIDVEPDEASKLIWLIELLMGEWYIHRHEREERLKELPDLAAAKDLAKKVAVPGKP